MLAEQYFKGIFDQAGVAMAVIGLDGAILYANRALADLFGYEISQLESHNFNELTNGQTGDDFDAFCLSDDDDDQVLPGEAPQKYFHRSGREVWATLNSSPVHDDQGQLKCYIVHVEDVTQRRRVEQLEHDRRAVLEMVAQDQPLPSMLNHLVRLLERQMPGMSVSIMLLQDGTIRPFAPTLDATLADAIIQRPVTFAAALVGSSGGIGAAPRLADVETDRAWEGLREPARAAGVKCCWAVTVTGADALPLGLLVLFVNELRNPTSAEQAVLETAIRLVSIGVEHHLTTRQLAHLVRHDPLTGLPNRILFEDRLLQAIATARRSGKPLALMAMDLNRFKFVNDTYGHQAGDSILQQFAHRLQSRLRESDTLARVGGDEFMLILPDATGRADSEAVADRLKDALAGSPMEIGGRSMYASASIGIAMFPDDGDDPTLLQRAADTAMYRAKELSRRAEPAPSGSAAIRSMSA